MLRSFALFFVSLIGFWPLFADTVTIKSTKEVIENVKTSSPDGKNILVESQDGTRQAFKINAVTVVSSPVVWEEVKVEKPGFFASLFGKQEPTPEAKPNATDSTAETPEEHKGFLAKRFPELTMGAMALLWILLP